MNSRKKRKDSHQQSKYLTLMLIPDSTATKVRSLKIPHWFIHLSCVTALVVCGTIAALSMINSYSQRRLQETAQIIENTLEETAKIVEETTAERQELLDQKERVEAQKRNIENVLSSQQGDFDQQIEFYIDQLVEIEAKLQDIELKAQESYEKMDIQGSPVSKETVETFMGGLYRPILEEDVPSTDMLNMLLAAVTVECDNTNEFLEAYAEDVESFSRFKDSFPNVWPVWGRVTSEYGGRADPFNGGAANHTGIDIKASTGTQVKAAGAGTVTKAEYVSGYGNMVVIRHGYGYETAYAHNSELLVEEGDKVKRGDYIALSGNTGRSTGPHVHFEIKYQGAFKNPRNYIGLLDD